MATLRGGLLLLTLAAFFGNSACTAGKAGGAATGTAAVPAVSGALVGPPQTVFDTKQSCEQIDIPDAFPRAFRDDHGTVHLIASHYVARAMLGPTLDEVKRDCRVIYRSLHDPDPAHFLDANWVSSVYTDDGHRVAALMHSEYHGDEHPGMCGDLLNPRHAEDCAWTAITFAESRDGGYTFTQPHPPGNLAASLPYPYDKYNKGGAQGYNSPTNILKVGAFYYAFINVWREYKAQRYGPCLIRTPNVFDPASWRAWDGKEFTIRFVDPYIEPHGDAAGHVCPPVVMGTIDSLAVDQRTGVFVGDVYVEDDRYGHGPGLYLMASRDLIHWSNAQLIAGTASLLSSEPAGNWSYLYFALLDPVIGGPQFRNNL